MITDSVESDHYIIGGKKYARVSTILRARDLIDFSGIPEKDRDFYLSRGTEVHRMMQHIEEGNADKFDYDPRVQLYRTGHARFIRETGFKALPGGIEVRVKATWKDLGLYKGDRDDDGVAGRIDRLGTIQNRVILADYKTSSVPDWCRIQTAIYAILLSPGYKFSEMERYGVAIKNDGTYQFSEKYPYSDRDEAMHHIREYRKSKS